MQLSNRTLLAIILFQNLKLIWLKPFGTMLVRLVQTLMPLDVKNLMSETR